MGSSDGKLYIYDVAEKTVSPKDSEWSELQKTVQSLTGIRELGMGGDFGNGTVPVEAVRYR